MLDIKFIRENKELIAMAAKKKHVDFDVEKLVSVDDKRREALVSIESKRTQQNEFAKKISTEADPGKRATMIEESKLVKDELQKEEEAFKEVLKEWQLLMLQTPNVPDMTVPDGDSDADNIEVRTWGEIPKFKFTPKSHVDLMEMHNMADFERGTKVAGFRGYFLKGDGARLDFAVWQYAMEFFGTRGLNPILVPSLVKKETLMGTGYLPQGEDDLYKTQDNEYLAGTGEVAAMAYHMDEILDKSQLPIKFLAFSPCFRREAGAHGKDTRGIMRVHEFFKFEQLILCEASHEKSVQHHEEVARNSEEFLQALNVPYHVVVNCGGDLGLGQVKKYDIEAWVPSENKYRETHSASYFHDFQTRRLNIRYRDESGAVRFVHSLNNTAIATPRILISLIENNQQEDGSISVPEALRKYLGKDVIKK